MPLHKQIFLTFRLTAGLQRAVNVPQPVNPSVVNPLLPNHVSQTFIRINVSAHLLNHLAVVKLPLLAVSLPVNYVAGSNDVAANRNQNCDSCNTGNACCAPAPKACAAPAPKACCAPAPKACAAPAPKACCAPAPKACAAPAPKACCAPAPKACTPAPKTCAAPASCCNEEPCCNADPCEIAELIYQSQTACYAKHRRKAIHKLGDRFTCECNPEIMCAFIYALNDADERVRAKAADEIGDQLRKNDCCCSPELTAALTCALGDCDKRLFVKQLKLWNSADTKLLKVAAIHLAATLDVLLTDAHHQQLLQLLLQPQILKLTSPAVCKITKSKLVV